MSLFETLGETLRPEVNMMTASIVVMSHLSDASIEATHTSGVNAVKRINFAKYIILHTGGDLNQKINPDQLWLEFNKPVETLKSK